MKLRSIGVLAITISALSLCIAQAAQAQNAAAQPMSEKELEADEMRRRLANERDVRQRVNDLQRQFNDIYQRLGDARLIAADPATVQQPSAGSLFPPLQARPDAVLVDSQRPFVAGSPYASFVNAAATRPALSSNDDATHEKFRRQISWQPMRRSAAVNWQPVKRMTLPSPLLPTYQEVSRENVIRAIEDQLAEILHAGERLGINPDDVLQHLRYRNAQPFV